MVNSQVECNSLYDNHIRNINPSGEHEISSIILYKAIKGGKIPDKTKFDKVVESYRSYVEEWNITYEDSNPQYIAKDDKLKSFGDFIKTGMYNTKSFSKTDARYLYLFGSKNFDDVRKKHQAFKNKANSSGT